MQVLLIMKSLGGMCILDVVKLSTTLRISNCCYGWISCSFTNWTYLNEFPFVFSVFFYMVFNKLFYTP